MIAISGTRTDYKIQGFQKEVLYKIIKKAKRLHVKIAVGDCTGIDSLCKKYCQELKCDFKLFESKNKGKISLRQRTIKLISESEKVFCFPSGLKFYGSGTWLACFEASRQEKESFIVWDSKDHNNLPKTKNIKGWELISKNLFKPCIVYDEQLKMEF